MLILKTNAEQIFWLGRYLARIEYICQHFPFQSDDIAIRYAQAFLLDADSAQSLNVRLIDHQYSVFGQLYCLAKANVYDLRGVLTGRSYWLLNRIFDRATKQPMPCIQPSKLCMQILENEPLHALYIFYRLGICLERLDANIRLQQTNEDLSAQMISALKIIVDLGHADIEQSLERLQHQLNSDNLSKLSVQINAILNSKSS